MRDFFVSLFNTCVRNLDMSLRITIAVVLFCVALLCLRLSFRKKNDKHPLALGWFFLCLISIFVATVYLVV